jgi:spore coat polysaccharide biosynthesis protein SpsF (cytidylyltransferase family)
MVCRIKDSEDTEMMWTYFKDTGLFKTGILASPPKEFIRDDIRMTLDYEDDFIFFKHVIDHFYQIGKMVFSLRDILKYLEDNSNVIMINNYLHEEWKKNQVANTKLSLKDIENG